MSFAKKYYFLISAVVFISHAFAITPQEQKKYCYSGQLFFCRGLGMTLEKDKNTQKDALNLYKYGCSHGDKDSCELGAHLAEELDLFADLESLGKEGCKLGASRACQTLALTYQKRKNKEDAIFYFKRSCELGAKDACAQENGLREGTPKYQRPLSASATKNRSLAQDEKSKNNVKKAHQYFIAACMDGDADSCVNAGIYESEHGTKKQAIEFHQKGCDLDLPLACGYVQLLSK